MSGEKTIRNDEQKDRPTVGTKPVRRSDNSEKGTIRNSPVGSKQTEDSKK